LNAVTVTPACANCRLTIPEEFWNAPHEALCRGCGLRVIAHVFPAIHAASATGGPARLEAEGEASCFYHAANRAAIACDACGRFLCSLCDLDLDGRHLCPGCLDRSVRVDKAASLETQKTQYDALALHLTTWPVLTLWGPAITAPAALFLLIKHWREPMSILPRGGARKWIALLLAIAEIVGIVALAVFLIWFIPRLPSGG
jgi:hypothetical protein